MTVYDARFCCLTLAPDLDACFCRLTEGRIAANALAGDEFYLMDAEEGQATRIDLPDLGTCMIPRPVRQMVL